MTLRSSIFLTALFRVIIISIALLSFQTWGQDANSLLWEISGNNLKKTSYLFGTIHVLCPGDFKPDDPLKSRLLTVDRLILEMDMTDPELMPSLMQAMMMKDGMTLHKLLSAPEYEKIDRFFSDSIGISITAFSHNKPFILTSLLFTYILHCTPQSVEEQLTNLAGEYNITVSGLETPQQQAALFDQIPYRTQAEMVLRMIDNLPMAREEFTRLLNLYRSQSVQKLYEYASKSQFDFNGFDKILLADRNSKWVSHIERLSPDSASFIAVGAAHLGGKKGLIQLLKNKGYKLSPVRTP